MDVYHPSDSGCVVSFSFMACSGHHISLRLLSLHSCNEYLSLPKKKKQKNMPAACIQTFSGIHQAIMLGRGRAASKRAACLLGRGSANVGLESPAHHTAMQYAPPQDPVLPVEEGSTG